MQAIFDSPGPMIVATGLLVGVAAALLGPFLVLRRNSMLSDAISHSIVLGIVTVWLLTGYISGPVQIVGAALTGVLTVVLTEVLVGSGRVKDDAAIGLVFPALFSIGVLLVNVYARDVHIDTHAVLLGEIGFVWLDTVPVGGYQVPKALVWMSMVTVVNAGFIALFWKELKLATFDPVLAQAFGFRPRLMFHVLLFLVSGTAVAAFDAVGAILFVAFVIVPPAAAYLLTDSLLTMVLLGVAVAAISTGSGYALAVSWDVSIGGMMAVMTGICLGAAAVLGPRYGLIAGLRRRARLALENDARALVVHLAIHEAGGQQNDENLAVAMRTHLGWPAAQARAVLLRGLDEGLVVREGAMLVLTPKGKAEAEALLQPWRRGGG